MLTFKEIDTQYNMYNNPVLNDFILSLEEKYLVVNEVDFFNDLVNFSRNSGVPLHHWFKYREGYSNRLVADLLRRYPIKSNQLVLDPFCGSGTTLAEAGYEGFQSLGVDANPMSVEISNAKANSYTIEEVSLAKNYLTTLNDLDLLANPEQLNEYNDTINYFNPNNLLELLNINRFINEQIQEEKIITLFRAGYLSIIEECSDRKRDGNGLKFDASKVQNVKVHFMFKMDDILNDVQLVQLRANGTAFWGTATNMNDIVKDFSVKENKTVGSIIFSPPYANSFDYFESYKMELRLGGFIPEISKAALEPFRKLAVRSFVTGGKDNVDADKYIEALAEEIELAIPLKEAVTGKKDLRTRKVPKMIKGYFADMHAVLEQCYHVLDHGGYCSIVVDQSSYLGKIVPTDLLLAYAGECIGFTVEEIIICRRAKTSSQQMVKYPYLKNSLRESIVVLKKL